MTTATQGTRAGRALDQALASVAAVVVLGTFRSILDSTIVNVALNTLADSCRIRLRAGPDGQQQRGRPTRRAGSHASRARPRPLFALRSLRARRPLIDLRLFRRGAMGASAVVILFIAIGSFGTMIMLPLYYQLVRHQTPLDTGLLIAPLGLGAAAIMPVVARFSDRTGPGKIVLAGMIPFLAGLIRRSQPHLRLSGKSQPGRPRATTGHQPQWPTAEEKTVIADIHGRFRPFCTGYRPDGSEGVMPR
jgi:hypothetical protein